MQFTYEENDRLFGERQSGPPQRQGIGLLLNKYGKKMVDEQQQQQIQRKRLVYPANSLNYSQIYSDLRIDYLEKTKPNDSPSTLILPKPPESFNYIPKSLPKIKRNSRLSNHIDNSKYVLNNNAEEGAGTAGDVGFSRTKVFSISHYDIYKNQTKHLEASERKQKNNSTVPLQEFLSRDSDVLSRQLHKNEEHLIKVDYQSIGEEDLPEPKEQEANQNISKIHQKQPQIAPEHTLQQLSKEEIKIERRIELKTATGALQAQPFKEQIIKDNRHTQQDKEGEEQNDQSEKEVKFDRRDSIISNSSSIRRKKKEIKRENSKKMKQENRKASFSQTKNKQQSGAKDADIQGKTQGQINLFQRKIQKPIESPQLKHSLTSIHPKDEDIMQEFAKFKQEMNNVKRQIHSVKEQMHEVKEEVHQFKEGPYIKKEGSQSRVSEKRHEQSAKIKRQINEDTLQRLPPKDINKDQQLNQHEHQKQKQEISKKQTLNNQQQTYRDYENHKFMINNYIQVYQILKEMQKDLKVPQINFHGLIKAVKKYLQVVAMGGLDHVEQYDMPLNRLKIIKNALLYQRISIVIVAFAYAVGKVKESLKYLINLVAYATNNTFLILKILEGGENNNDSKNPILAKSDRLVIKKNFDTIRNNNDIILDSIFKISKQEEAFFEPFKEILKSIGKNSIEQTFYNVLEYFSFFLCVSELSNNLPFLAVAPNPYLRESLDKRPTLVIDIIEVFCHGTKKSKSHVFRPHTEHFLNEMAQYYQIISFTCAYPNQIDKVINILDQKRHIKHRLYRHHALMKNNFLCKDPERIGRDLSRLIILDSQVALMSEESANTIVVPSWKGNRNDTTLAQLCPILAAIALKRLDCRQATKKMHQQQMKNQQAGIKYLNFGINLE